MANARRGGPFGWQIAALATAGGLGALALANRLSSAAAGETYTVLEGQRRRYTWTHGDIFYTVKGRGEPLVLIHGVYAGASSFEFRRVFDRLAERHRVYAIDLLGFGLSDRPAVLYTPELYIRLIQDFVRQVVGGMDHPVRVIASTLGAAFTIRAANERPDLFDRLALIEPTGIQDLASPANTPAKRIFCQLLRTPLFGESFYNAIASRPGIRYFLRKIYSNRNEVSDDLIDYYFSTAHQRGARFAPASFISGRLNTRTREAFAQVDMPILLLWGKQANFTPLEHAQLFREANARAELRIFESGSLPQDERPQDFVREVNAWLNVAAPRKR
ncbi:MAG TPA: alpha/beta fold hydrolase [Ktedonobacterales bacterium]|nr:alpha/beta fold hydrolase [Ktedonobacterales bacterium]